jgi:hypothetical protein
VIEAVERSFVLTRAEFLTLVSDEMEGRTFLEEEQVRLLTKCQRWLSERSMCDTITEQRTASTSTSARRSVVSVTTRIVQSTTIVRTQAAIQQKKSGIERWIPRQN